MKAAKKKLVCGFLKETVKRATAHMYIYTCVCVCVCVCV